ncbi:hypothetical protein BHE74_00019208 [Ensete ventricosum]|nr:hypothetical protein BHE74_00019208 [Ensete ventricosum]RZR89140.1 hypothetical protein BHM03_00016834 [Ensete ventricosum]
MSPLAVVTKRRSHGCSHHVPLPTNEGWLAVEWDGASCYLRMLCKGRYKAMRDRGGCGLSVENEGDGRGSIGGRRRHQVEEEGMCLHEVATRSKRSCSEDRQWDRCFDTK